MFQYWSLSKVLLLSAPRGNGEVVMHFWGSFPWDDMGVLSPKDTGSQQVKPSKEGGFKYSDLPALWDHA